MGARVIIGPFEPLWVQGHIVIRADYNISHIDGYIRLQREQEVRKSSCYIYGARESI